MKNYLIVVDMQNDFIDGSLGTKEAEAIVATPICRNTWKRRRAGDSPSCIA